MNADSEISPIALKNVLTLPSSAIKTANGASTVTILDNGKPLTWDVEIGEADGAKTQIVAGLDEGQKVVTIRKATSAATTTRAQQNPVLDAGPGEPPSDGGIGGMISGMIR